MPTIHRTLALLGLLAATGAPAAHAAAKPAGPILKLEAKTCNVGTAADARTIVITASAVLRDTGDEVQMRFTVQQRATGKSPWRSVFAKVGDLGTWTTSEPGADGLRYTKTINGLTEGTQYRVVVDSRAVSDAGKVVTRSSRRTFTCIQPQISAHLELQKVTQPVVASGPTLRVTIRNTGRETSTEPVVTVRDPATQAILGQLTAQPLDGKASTTVSVPLRDCQGTVNLTVQATGEALTDVSADQTATWTCADDGDTGRSLATRARR